MSERRSDSDLISVTISDGKYTIRQTEPGMWEALRYGEEWPAFRDQGPDNLHVALAYAVDTTAKELMAERASNLAIKIECDFLLARLDEINLDDDTDDLIRDWNGHVEPSIARLRVLIGAAA